LSSFKILNTAHSVVITSYPFFIDIFWRKRKGDGVEGKIDAERF
jgi:hypothetical protein